MTDQATATITGKPRVGIVFMGRKAGLSNVTCELARAMAPLADVTCYLSAYNELADEFAELPCRIRDFPTYTGLSSFAKSLIFRDGPRHVAKAIIQDAPDVVIDTGSGPWRGIIQGYLKGRIPLAEIVHDVQHHPDRWFVLWSLADRMLPSRADIYIALSHFSHGLLVQRFPEADHVESRLGILHPAFNPNPAEVASKRDRMLFFGRIEKYKGVDVLADAFEIALASRPDLKLSVVGGGPIDPQVVQKLQDLGANLRNGWLPTEEIPSVIASHGVMVIPYISATQSAIAAVALANGMPSVATSTGALPEQIIDGRNGLIVPPGDAKALAQAMLKIAGDESLARAMSVEALEVARELYAWDQIATKLLADLLEIAPHRVGKLCDAKGRVDG